MEAAVKTVARVLANNDMQPTQYGNNELCRIDSNHEANVLEGISHVSPCVDSHVSSLVPRVESDLTLDVDNANGLKEVNKEVGLFDTRPKKQMAKWTRLNRMEVGLYELNNSYSMPTLGKRFIEVVLEVSNAVEAATLYQKRSKVDCSNDDSDFTLAGVEDHPCWEQ